MATQFEERRAKIDAAATHGNPAFGRDQLEALRAHAENDAAEALTALVGVVSELVDRLGGWQRIGAITLPDGTEVSGVIPESAIVGEREVGPDGEPMGEPERDDDDIDDDLDELEVGDEVAAAAEPGTLLGEVSATGSSEGRTWVKITDEDGDETGKVWAEQLVVYVAPAPAETEATNPEDGAELRRKAAAAHLEHIEDEPKVEYEQATFEAGESGEFDVPIGMQGAPVKVKSKGGKS